MDKMNKFIPIFIVLMAVISVSTAENQTFYNITYHQFMTDAIYKHEYKLSALPSQSGAMSVNIAYENNETSVYYIEMQRYLANWISAGIALEKQAFISIGSLIGDWGFSKQGPQGSFPGTGDGVHSVSLFIEAAARATVLMMKAQLTSKSAEWIPLLKLSGAYMTQPDVKAHGRENNLDPFTHRFFLRAAALEMVAFLSGGNHELSQEAKSYVVEGLAKQDAQTGILPERDGFDFNYQSISLAFLGRYYMFIDDNVLKTAIANATRNALPSLQRRVDELGNVNLSDSTRINEPGRNGKPKTLDYPNVLSGLLFAHAVTGMSEYLRLAKLLAYPVRPLIEYKFDRVGTDGQKNSGTASEDGEGDIFARTAENAKDLSPLGAPRSGVTGRAEDYAYDLTSNDGMGKGPGKFARTGPKIEALDSLLSFTMSGWFKADIGQVLGSNIDIFRSDRFKLTGVHSGHLRLFVDSESGSDAIVSTKRCWNQSGQWVFFAVSYDGTKSINNVKFYHATIETPVKLSSTQTLDRQRVDAGKSRLSISRQNRPFDGFFDNMRIYGSKQDSGVISQELLEQQRQFDLI